MIRISVLTHQGAHAGRTLSAQFDAQGGTIGRAPANTLVLDDPDRTVSRVHAQVLCREGQYFIVDRGSNPMLCNGRPLGAGNEAALSQGMRLVIGGFELVVEAAPSAASAGAAA
ncbi:FHA domain-containing protein, partial [Variovorax sp. WDL1]